MAAASASALLVGGQGGEHRVEFGDPLALRGDVTGQRDGGAIEALELGLDRPAFALHPGERLGGGVEPGVVRVETRAELGLRGAGGGEFVVGAAHCVLGVGEPVVGGGRLLAGPVELGRRGAARRRADAPAAGTEAVADVGHDDRVGVGDRHVDRGRGLGDTDRVADQRIEQGRQPRPVGMDVRSHGLADVRHRGGGHPHADGEDGAARVGVGQGTRARAAPSRVRRPRPR